MLIVGSVFVVSQGDFFGSKICQGMRVQSGTAILTLMDPRTLRLRLTSGMHPPRPLFLRIQMLTYNVPSTIPGQAGAMSSSDAETPARRWGLQKNPRD